MSDTDDPPVRLEATNSWTDFYYDIIEAYFWRPQAIGRASNPKLVNFCTFCTL